MSKRILFISRGRPGLGHVVPCVALEKSLMESISELKSAHISYGLGPDFLASYDSAVLPLDFEPSTSGYPGLPLFRGLYPNLKDAVCAFKPDLVIGSGDYHLPILTTVERIPCCMLMNTAYFTIEGGYFAQVRSLFEWLYQLSDLNIEYNMISNFLVEGLRKKTIHTGPILRKPLYDSREEAREKLNIPKEQRVVVVTKGGGDDSTIGKIEGKPLSSSLKSISLEILQDAAQSFGALRKSHNIKMILVGGLGFNEFDLGSIRKYLSDDLMFIQFTNDMVSYVQAADVVVGRAGINFMSEALGYGNRAIFIPMSSDVEQLNNVASLESRGLCRSIPSDALSVQSLREEITLALESAERKVDVGGSLRDFILQGRERATQLIIERFL